jgi:hypothetical protein
LLSGSQTSLRTGYRRWFLLRLLNDRPDAGEDRHRAEAEAMAHGDPTWRPRDGHMGGRLALLTGGGGAKFASDTSATLLQRYGGTGGEEEFDANGLSMPGLA